MKLPQHLVESRFFCFSEYEDFLKAIEVVVDDSELQRISRLVDNGHLPLTSKEVLATIFGMNAGIIWSLVNRTERHYRRFSIPKGKGKREIIAPRVGLKIIQKWISVQLQNSISFSDHVFGFVPGLCHIDAASQHVEAKWIYSVDLENFFPSTPKSWVLTNLCGLGYDYGSAELITKLSCFDGYLAQGAPSSPVLSNISMLGVDHSLSALARKLGVRVTRYADDITFSSTESFPESLPEIIADIFRGTPWSISKGKTNFAKLPARLKVHGLLVNGASVKLTKGYRNKLRAYRHVLGSGECRQEDKARLLGHMLYAKQVSRYAS